MSLFCCRLIICIVLLVDSENDRVMQVNTIAMDNVPHSFAVQSLRKCGKVAKIVSICKVDLYERPSRISLLTLDISIG